MTEQAHKCDGCTQLYGMRNPPEDPPCETCKETPLKENENAIRIFAIVRHQFIVGMGGPIDVNHLSIHEAMRLYGIKNKKECFEKVLTLSEWWLSRIRETSES
jgi:hypothetical protein